MLPIVTLGRGEHEAGPTAAAAFTRPFDQLVPVPTIGSAVWTSRSTIAAALVPYAVDQSNPATAETCGVAGEVPLTVSYEPTKLVE
jgi:hypothetical protein